MNNKELQALRKLFFLSTAEAAEHIGGVSARSWQHWESGRYKVPDDVAEKMNSLIHHRLSIIKTCEDLIEEKAQGIESIYNHYYLTLSDYEAKNPEANVIHWRMAQCVAAYFLGSKIASIK